MNVEIITGHDREGHEWFRVMVERHMVRFTLIRAVADRVAEWYRRQ